MKEWQSISIRWVTENDIFGTGFMCNSKIIGPKLIDKRPPSAVLRHRERMTGRALSLIVILMLFASNFTLISPAFAAAGDGAAHFERAFQYELQGNVDAAILEYHQGLQDDPDSVDGHTRLGVLLIEQKGDVDGAISEFVTALGIDPSCGYCQTQLDAAVERRNSPASENIARGNECYRLGQLSRAVAAYRVAIYADPGDAEAHNSLAWTLYRIGNLNAALAEVKEALRLKPDDAEYVNTLACILYDKGDLEGAIAQWHRAIEHSKSVNPADLYGLAIGYLAKGDMTRAADNFKQALKNDPNYKDPAYLRDKIGMSVHALASHEKLLSISSEMQK